ncbi:hypothetical protein AJ79_07610 [Helicocarpus griseus UAMH5409]|uniref:Uncharacterized protein n=1 Tax=Helicocarpus griseus UAMH5409 TaxID=1447875 RepID=A0A2B7X115_9EURO|nr:hypothetical protein AJ79_07610 [Helicocarpus griseus UAMH5409]
MQEANELAERLPRSLFESAATIGVIEPAAVDITITYAQNIVRRSYYDCRLTAKDLFPPDLRSLMYLGQKATVALILCRHPDYQAYAHWYLNRLAEAKDPIALIYVLSRQINSGNLKSTVLIDHLAEVAQRQFYDAMVLYGRVLHEKYNRTDEALLLWKKAMDTAEYIPRGKSGRFYTNQFNLTISHAWEMYASVKAEQGDTKSALEAVKDGAFNLGDPEAFKILAKSVGSEGRLDEYEDYMTKAAMAADAEACHDLGSFYLELYYHGKYRGKAPSKRNGESRKDQFCKRYTINRHLRLKAMDWLDVACEGGWGPSALLMAALVREDGELDEGDGYLKVAEEDKKTAKRAKHMRPIYKDLGFQIFIDRELLDKQLAGVN